MYIGTFGVYYCSSRVCNPGIRRPQLWPSDFFRSQRRQNISEKFSHHDLKVAGDFQGMILKNSQTWWIKTHKEQHLSDLVPVRFPFLCFARHGTAEWLPGRPLGNSKSCNLVLCDNQKPLQKAAANVVFCVNLCFCLCCCWRWGLARGNEQLET